MEKAIMKNPFFLSQVSEEATKEDLYLAQDLQDTLRAHQDSCVGMAANMIGVRKRVIIIQFGLMPLVLFNPVLVKKEGVYETEEGCLYLAGSRKTSRFEKIQVSYLDMNWKPQLISLEGFAAQICQHELDHLEGILI